MYMQPTQKQGFLLLFNHHVIITHFLARVCSILLEPSKIFSKHFQNFENIEESLQKAILLISRLTYQISFLSPRPQTQQIINEKPKMWECEERIIYKAAHFLSHSIMSLSVVCFKKNHSCLSRKWFIVVSRNTGINLI